MCSCIPLISQSALSPGTFINSKKCCCFFLNYLNKNDCIHSSVCAAWMFFVVQIVQGIRYLMANPKNRLSASGKSPVGWWLVKMVAFFGLHFFQQVKTVIAHLINGSFKSLTYFLSSAVWPFQRTHIDMPTVRPCKEKNKVWKTAAGGIPSCFFSSNQVPVALQPVSCRNTYLPGEKLHLKDFQKRNCRRAHGWAETTINR